jgi:hypothetical protein
MTRGGFVCTAETAGSIVARGGEFVVIEVSICRAGRDKKPRGRHHGKTPRGAGRLTKQIRRVDTRQKS